MAPAHSSDLVLDPWTEPTPSDLVVSEVLLEPERAPLPGFVVPGTVGAAEVTGAEIPVQVLRDAPLLSSADVADAGLGPAAPPDWADEEPDLYAGDGPFASAVDAPLGASSMVPVARGASRFAEALRSEPMPSFPQPDLLEALPARALVPAHVKAEFDKPHRIQRRAPSVAPRSVAEVQRESKTPPAPVVEPLSRHYPKMRSLLKDPDSVPYGSAPSTPEASRPVPGTFFPAVRAPKPKSGAEDLDGLLITMAEGLLVGEGPTGGTEIRVNLKDEFFAGTELRIELGDGAIKATLIPPDREIYWQLNAHIDDLEARLSGKGLRVQSIVVLEPGA